MSILASLTKAYERIPEAPPFGFSVEKIGFVISLNNDGTVANVVDLRNREGKKTAPRRMRVPQPKKRSVDIAPNFLWDKTSYVLGVTGENLDGLDEKKRAKKIERLADERASFSKRHLDVLRDTNDQGLMALRLFLESWKPEEFSSPLWPEDMKDQNLVFALEHERRRDIYLHDRPAAIALWTDLIGEGERTTAVCFVTGSPAPISRLHPAIKGVWDAQSSGVPRSFPSIATPSPLTATNRGTTRRSQRRWRSNTPQH
jgi:CRISPR-associated protein Csd1